MTTPEIERGLRLIRLRQQRMMTIFLAFFPSLVATYGVSQLFSASEMPVIGVALGYGVLSLVYSLRLVLTECPRCGDMYHLNWWANPFTRRCLNCGLSLDAGGKRS